MEASYSALQAEVQDRDEKLLKRDQAYENKKNEYYKLQDEFKRKCEMFDTLKAVAKEI